MKVRSVKVHVEHCESKVCEGVCGTLSESKVCEGVCGTLCESEVCMWNTV